MAFLSLTRFDNFQTAPGSQPGETIFTSPVIASPVPWNELILSWNITNRSQAGYRFEARPIHADREAEAPFYNLGFWTRDPGRYRRQSVNGQKDDIAQVKTDTLALKSPAERLQLRIVVSDAQPHATLPIHFLGLSLCDTSRILAPSPGRPGTNVTAKVLPVPERSQVSYKDGRDWCSPTSVSMVLAYWAMVLGRAELDIDVPMVAAAVNDPEWPGTGNWPFNTAFAGGFPGMRACVTRLSSVSELEALVEAGVPPIVSVSFDLLNGKEKDQGTGHLIVLVGTTSSGDLVINDPWAFLDKGERVQRTVSRQTLARAWGRSSGIIYLIHPETWKMPAGGI